jgi:hypothetical protein
MMKTMTELFIKNQHSNDMTLEQMEHSIAGIIDRVEVLETGVRATDHDKLPDDTREDDYDEEDEMEEVDDEEPFNPPPRPPPRWHHRDDQRAHQELPRPPHRPNWQGMGGHPNRLPNQQHAHSNDDPFTKVKLMIPPFYGLYDAEAYLDWEMTVDNKFISLLVPEQHRVRQATSEFKDFAII